ncbi:MAG: multidrug efflux system outer membrane protein [Myxococcota bacterium]|jgi:multidrug efflux system outer membrane protein
MNKISIFALLMCAACASPANDLPEVTINHQAFKVNQKASLDNWWHSFGNNELNLLLEDVVSNNLDLAAAAENLQAVAATTNAIIGTQLPSLDLAANLGKSRSNIIGLPIPGAGDVVAIESDRVALDLRLSWELDLFGRLDAQEASSLAQLDASTANYAALHLALSGQAVRTWLAYQFAQQQAASLRTSLVMQGKLLSSIEDASQLASNSALVFATRSEMLATKTQLAQSEMQLEQLRQALQTLTSSDALSNISTSALPELSKLPDLGVEAQLIARRPDLIALEAQLRAAAAKVDVAHAALYPSFFISAALGGSSDELGNLLNGDYRTWSFGGNVLAPLFHGGALRQQQAAAQHQYQASSLSFVQHCLRAFAEVATLLNNERLLDAQVNNALQINDLAQQRLAANHDALALGVGNAQGVLRSSLLQQQTQLQLLSSNMLLLQNRVDLHLALGGGFTQ